MMLLEYFKIAKKEKFCKI